MGAEEGVVHDSIHKDDGIPVRGVVRPRVDERHIPGEIKYCVPETEKKGSLMNCHFPPVRVAALVGVVLCLAVSSLYAEGPLQRESELAASLPPVPLSSLRPDEPGDSGTGVETAEEVFLLFPNYSGAHNIPRFYRNGCGPFSLFVIMHCLGKEIETSTMIDEVIGFETRGCTLQDISDLAAKYGLYSKGIECRVDALPKLGYYAVVLRKKHFVALTGATSSQDRVQIVDFPAEPKILTVTGSAGSEKCLALLVSDQPGVTQLFPSSQLATSSSPLTSESKGKTPALSFDSDWLDVGVVCKPTKIETHLTNSGSETVVLGSVKSSCPCVRPDVDVNSIVPGGKATVTLTIVPNEKLGHFEQRVLVETVKVDDAPSPLLVTGEIVARVVVNPPVLTVPMVYTGASVSSVLDVSYEGEKTEFQLQVPPDQPVNLSFEPVDEKKGRLHFSWCGAADPGWRHFEVFFVDSATKEPCSAPIYCAVNVVSMVRAVPEVLVFRSTQEEQTCSRTIALLRGGRSCSIARAELVEEPAIPVFRASLPMHDPVIATLAADPAELRRARGMKATLAMTTTEGFSVLVPIFVE